MKLDWHAEDNLYRPTVLIDNAPESAGINLAEVRRYRQQRLRKEMAKREIAAVVLCDPVNIRYATGTRNMQVFSQRNGPSRYLLLTLDRSILFEFTGCLHLADGFDTVDEVRPSTTSSFVAAGPAIAQREKDWVREMADTLRELVGGDATIGLERMNAGVSIEFGKSDFHIVDAQEPVEMARAIKSDGEIQCIKASLRATEAGVQALRDAIAPGQTENELWSVLHQAVIAGNGDYVETRLLNSGHRTNPWFQESAHKVIRENELIALDTDVVGCHGYYADFSRTFHSGPDKPTAAQRTLYKVAYEQVYHNMDLIKPGVSFSEYAERAWDIPDRYFDNRYYLSAHGVGMTGEYPYLYHRSDYAAAGYEGEIISGMTICVESYIGEKGGAEGVKLEQQVLVTDSGNEILSHFPFETDLLV